MKKLTILILFIITLLGFLERLNFYTYHILDDIGRDMVVAKNFFTDKNTSLFIRPNSSLPGLPNTPCYFWVISILYLIGQSPFGVLCLHSFLCSLIIPISFLAIKNISNNKLGLMTAFLIALSPTMIRQSLTITQYSLLPLFITLSFMFLTSALNSKPTDTKSLYNSIGSMVPALLLHNSSIPIFISFSIVWLIISKKKSKKTLESVIYLIINIILFFILLSYQFRLDYLIFLFDKVKESPQIYSQILLSRCSQTALSILNSLNQPITNLIIFGILGLKFFISRHHISIFLLFIPILGIIISVFLPIESWMEHYFSLYYILLYLLISIFPVSIKGIFQSIIIVFILCLFMIHNQKLLWPIQIHTDPFSSIKKVSSIIFNKSLFIKNKENFEIIEPLSYQKGLPHLSNWFSPTLYIFQDPQLVNFKLVDSMESANNIYKISDSNLILVCLDDPQIDYLTLDNCKKDWKNYSEKTLQQIGEYTDNQIKYYIFDSVN